MQINFFWKIGTDRKITTVPANSSTDRTFCAGYKFSRASYVLSLLRPRIFRDLELKKHGLTVYLRKPSSYTPLKEEYQVSQYVSSSWNQEKTTFQDKAGFAVVTVLTGQSVSKFEPVPKF